MNIKHNHPPLSRRCRSIVVALLCLISFSAKAQDIHFSQIDINPLLFNPAYAGFFDGTGRFGVIYRNQWASVSVPFQTVAATAEFSLKRRKYQRDGFNVGLFLFNDRAGTLGYGTTAGNAVLSYFHALGQNDIYVSAGMEAGFGQSGFHTEDISLSDPSEGFEKTTSTYPTLGAGVAFFYQPHDMLYLKLGLSGRNLNRPNISYLGLDDTYLEPKFNAYLRMEYRGWPSLSILPLLACQFQKNNTEVIAGCDAKWYLNETSSGTTAFSAGIRYRLVDALYTEFALEHNAFIFFLDYDANLSKLTPASKSLGAFELGIVYRINKNQPIKRKAMPCPIM
ncbi:MAG: PorP/SprF family type IX secretion system membrane protein [Bacteroidales bacterium]|nr:PorP/SprF family type IX secretion system membrane protein [Bacteroidales bacterium]